MTQHKLTRTLLTAAILPVLCSAQLGFSQGPLAPLPGPPAPNMKSLDQLEPRRPISSLPFTISEPGSYYLTGNLQGTVSGGINVTCGGVTIDLMGFELGGGGGNGIVLGGDRNFEIRNGTIRNWSAAGIAASLAENCLFENLRLADNGQTGLATGKSSVVRHCVAYSNGGSGISAGSVSVVHDCAARENTLRGIFAWDGVIIRDCTVEQNGDAGIMTDIGTTVRGCISRNNKGHGIQVKDSCYVLENDATGNGTNGDGAGIDVTGEENRIEGNKVTANDRGVRVNGITNLIIRNTARGNSAGNYDIVAGNRVATIVVPPVSAAVTGNGPGAGSGVTDPVANIAY